MNSIKHVFGLLVASLIFIGCAAENGGGCQTENVDNGRLIRNDKELRPLYMPFEIVVQRNMLASGNNQSGLFHEATIREAIRWWNEKTKRRDLFRLRIVDNYNIDANGDLNPSWGQVYLRIEVATNINNEDIHDRGGVTFLKFNRITGVIYSAVMSINVILIKNPIHERNVLIHELGHILGLDDDPVGTNNKSAMRSKLVLTEDIILTEKDKELVLQL